jgi:hypothetical protein
VEQPSRAGRVARGKDARAVAPLDSHAEFRADRSRDPVGLLLGQAQSRVPELVPVRHERMLVSAFTFYRGRRCRWRQTWPAHPGGDAVMSETARAQRPGAAQPGRQRNFGGREAGTVDE